MLIENSANMEAKRKEPVDDANVKSISDCCLEWRVATVKPVYIHFSEPTIIPRSTWFLFSFTPCTKQIPLAHGKKAKAAGPPTEEELLALKQGCALKNRNIPAHLSCFLCASHL
jgi:hypothetical protein